MKIKKYIYEITAVSILVLGIAIFGHAAVTTLIVPQGGTGVNGLPANALVISGTTQTGALSATSSPTVGWIYATSTTATSTFSGGIVVSGGNIRISTLTACNGVSVLETDGSGNLQCGADAGGSPDIVLASIGGTTYLRASTTANTWYFDQGFVSNASSTLSGFTNIGVASSTNFISTASSTITGAFNTSGAITGASGLTIRSGTVSLPAGEIGNAELANSTISGVALGGTLGALTATNATLTFSGSYDGSTARTVGLNLGSANTWTALQTMGNLSVTASSTIGSVYIANGNLNLSGSITASTSAFLPAGFGGRSLTISGSALDADAELFNKIVSFSVASSTMGTTSASGAVAQHKFATAITITRVSCSVEANSATINLDSRAEATPNTAGTDVLSAALTCDSDSAASTSFTDAAIAADEPLALRITNPQPTATRPTLIRVHVEYEVND